MQKFCCTFCHKIITDLSSYRTSLIVNCRYLEIWLVRWTQQLSAEKWLDITDQFQSVYILCSEEYIPFLHTNICSSHNIIDCLKDVIRCSTSLAEVSHPCLAPWNQVNGLNLQDGQALIEELFILDTWLEMFFRNTLWSSVTSSAVMIFEVVKRFATPLAICAAHQ